MSLQVKFPPGFRGDVYVHVVDNGIVVPMADSAGRHALNVLANAFAFGPFALASPKNTVMLCSKCHKEFARNVYAHKINDKLRRLVAEGVLVVRQYSEPAVPYDPNAASA